MILILTDKNDAHANYVIEKIKNQNLPHVRLNLDVESLKNTIVKYQNGVWDIAQNNKKINLSSIKCIWNRRTFVELLLDEEYNQTVDFKLWKNEWNKTLLGIYSSLRHIKWLNPWRKSYEAENKYLQMELALKNKLDIPQTIVTNSKAAVLSFAEAHTNVALKLMHQDFYKQENVYKGLYVNKLKIEDFKKFSETKENPIVLQEYIDKDFEVRYTVVGQRHFVCKIESQKSKQTKIDWRRYDIPNTPHSIITPPKKIKFRVNALMKDLGIEYGALDFIVNKSNNWVFLEVNSMGQFLWIEDLTGLQISNEIISWMKHKLIA
jgi:glutathione synthase/RimK-type ligase-like ATP-grasp enzyme